MKAIHGTETGIATSSNSAYEIIKHKKDSHEYSDNSRRGQGQVIYDEVMCPPLPPANVGSGGYNMQSAPFPLPADPMPTISGDGKQNGVDDEVVYDVLHGDENQ